MPAGCPISFECFLALRFTNRKLQTDIVGNKQIMRPSLLMSVATTPQALPKYFPMPEVWETFGKSSIAVVMKQPTGHWFVKMRNAIANFVVGMRGRFLDLSKSTKRQTNKSSRPSLS